ncbi:hypothetical protein B0H10DRAFT_2088900 [Mycena sp. CBHHK59/15]|nr:hypothetical protein B0H10DRAFT_2088900 [Mycena sp. CBHHK59/15]
MDGKGLAFSCWLNTALYAMQLGACMFCISCSTRTAHKYGFLSAIISDAVGTTAVAVSWRKAELWALPAILVSNAVSAVFLQIYFVHFYWIISNKKISSSLIMALMGASSHFLLIIVISATGPPQFLLQNTVATYSLHAHFVPLYSAAAIVCTVADLHITFVTVWLLSGIETKRPHISSLIRALCLNVLASSTVAVTITLMSLLSLLLGGVTSTLFVTSFTVTGRIYSLTTSLNFIVHRKIKHRLKVTTMTVIDSQTSRKSGLSLEASPQGSEFAPQLSRFHTGVCAAGGPQGLGDSSPAESGQ